MLKIERLGFFPPAGILFLLGCLNFLAGAPIAFAQANLESPYYARVQSFGVFSAYSNDSSKILLGYSENRKLLDIGVSYSRRLYLNHIVNWQYNGELLPVALESDPVIYQKQTFISPSIFAGITQNIALESPDACQPGTGTINEGDEVIYNYVDTCGRRWTMGEAVSPLGMQWNFLPRSKTQPFFTAHGGYMYSTREIPIDSAGSFNFTFDLGAGIEMYRSRSQSIRAEYRYHHISNHNTAEYNPGIDNGLFQVTYSFGR